MNNGTRIIQKTVFEGGVKNRCSFAARVHLGIIGTLFALVMLCALTVSCGGGGGGGGGSAAGGTSGGGQNTSWGGGSSSKQAIAIDVSGLSSIGFINADPSLPAPQSVTWTGFALHFFVDGVETVYNLTPANPRVSIPNVPTGSTIRAYADISFSGGASRRAEAEPLTVANGHNNLTLYIPYYYSINAEDGSPLVNRQKYTAKSGITLASEYGGTTYSQYTLNSVTYYPGTRHGIKGDVTFWAVADATPPAPPPPTPAGPTFTYEGSVITGIVADTIPGDGIITVPNEIDGVTMTSIRNYAFQQKVGLKQVIISEGITTVGENAFDQCPNLESVQLPSSLTTLKKYAFNKCTSLTTVNIPDNITKLNDGMFFECSSLATVNTNKVTNITQGAFQRCTSLTTLIMPAVTKINVGAFSDCYTSVVLEFGNTTAPKWDGSGKSYGFEGTLTIKVPTGTDTTDSGWTAFKTGFSNNVTSINFINYP